MEKPPAEMTDGELNDAVAVEVTSEASEWSLGKSMSHTNYMEIAGAMDVFAVMVRAEACSAWLEGEERADGSLVWACGVAHKASCREQSSLPRAICEAALLWARARGV